MSKNNLVLWQKTLLIFAGILFPLLLAESSLRLAGLLLSQNLPVNDSNAETKNAIRILTLGPCITAGVAAPKEESYPKLLEKNLRNLHPGLNITVINGAVPGKNISFFANRMQTLVDEMKPDIIILNINRYIAADDENMVPAAGDLIPPGTRRLLTLSAALRGLRLYRLFSLLIPDSSSNTEIEKQASAFAARERLDEAKAIAPGTNLNKPEEEFWRLSFLGRYREALKVQHELLAGNQAFTEKIKTEQIKYESELRLNPKNYTALKRIARTRALLADYKAAVEYSAQALAINPHGKRNQANYLMYQNLLKAVPNQTSESIITSPHTRQLKTVWTFERSGLTMPTDGSLVFRNFLRFNLQKIKQVTDKNNIHLVLENSAGAPEQLPELILACRDMKIRLVDIMSAIEANPDGSSLYNNNDTRQLNAKAYSFIAARLTDVLTPEILRRGTGKR